MRQRSRNVCAVAMAVVTVLSVFFLMPASASRDVSTSLSFGSDGKFKILQISDTQDTQYPISNLLTLIQRALDESEPDLVVFTGDQLKSYDSDFEGDNTEAKVRKALDKIIEPVERRGIPFALCFGNHDGELSVTKEQQVKFLQEHNGCLVVDEGDTVDGVGNYNIPIYSSDGSKLAYNLYLLDSHGENGTAGQAHQNQIDWYKSVSNELKAQNGGVPLPSMLFQHIPLREYALAADVSLDEQQLREQSSESLFDAMLLQGDVRAVFVGHLHASSSVGIYKGIYLGVSPGATFNEFGDGMNRGVREITIDENNTDNFETRILTFVGLLGDNPVTQLRYFLFTVGEFDAYTTPELISKIFAMSLDAIGYAVRNVKKPGDFTKTLLEFFGADVGAWKIK